MKESRVSWYIIVYKFLFGFTEFVFGLGITIFGRAALVWYHSSVAKELTEDPNDLVVHLTRGIISGLLTHNTFLAIYLIILGSAKIAGAIGLIFRKNWGVDLLVGLTFIMFPFQFVQLLIHPSILDFLYIIVGLLIALYLVNFKPKVWATHMASKVKRRKS